MQRNFTPQFANLTSVNATNPLRYRTLVFDHNTHVGGGGLGDRVGDVYSAGIACGDGNGTGPNTLEDLQLTKNVLPAGATQIGSAPGSLRPFSGAGANTFDEDGILSACFPSAIVADNAARDWDGHSLRVSPSTKPVAVNALYGGSRTSTTPADYALTAAALARYTGPPGADVMRVLALTAGVDEPGLADEY